MPGGRDRRDMEIGGGWKVKEGVSEMEKGNRRERERERERERGGDSSLPCIVHMTSAIDASGGEMFNNPFTTDAG